MIENIFNFSNIQLKMKELYKKIISIFVCFFIMVIGLGLFKYLPMSIYGEDILFDASAHVVWTSFLLYVLWYFVDQSAKLRLPYFILSCAILIIVAVQRIVAGEHNEVGVLLGFAISIAAIVLSRWDYFRGKFDF